jgi:hypothetical protein
MSKTPLPYAGVYEKLDFPEYRYQEYPKMVRLKKKNEHGQDHVIVHNHAEELRAVEEIVTVSTFDTVLKQKEVAEQQLALLQKQLSAMAPGDLSDPGPGAPIEDETPAKAASPTIKVPVTKTS